MPELESLIDPGAACLARNYVVMILVEGGPEFGSMFGLSVKIRPDRVGEFLFRP